jgi:hypothetical protein
MREVKRGQPDLILFTAGNTEADAPGPCYSTLFEQFSWPGGIGGENLKYDIPRA